MDTNGPSEPDALPRDDPDGSALLARRVIHDQLLRVEEHDRTAPWSKTSYTQPAIYGKGGIFIVAIDPQGRVGLVKQWRGVPQAWCIELPGGSVDPGEEPIQAAARELGEETGLRSDTWHALGELLLWPVLYGTREQVFLCIDAVSEPELIAGEPTELMWLSLDAALDACGSGILDAGTIAALHMAAHRLHGRAHA